MLEAVIFDMDGVMFDTEKYSRMNWEEAGAAFGHPEVVKIRPKIIGANAAHINEIVREQCGPDFPVDEFLRMTGELMEKRLENCGVPVKDGLRELLEYLKANRIPCAVASSTARGRVLSNCGETGVTPYFSKIICGDMVRKSKPDPQIYLTAARELGADPAGCVVLEDSLNGCRAGCNAGMMTVMIPDEVQPDDELRGLLYACVTSLREVIPLLERLKQEDEERS